MQQKPCGAIVFMYVHLHNNLRHTFLMNCLCNLRKINFPKDIPSWKAINENQPKKTRFFLQYHSLLYNYTPTSKNYYNYTTVEITLQLTHTLRK